MSRLPGSLLLLIVMALVLALPALATLLTDWMWFRSLDHEPVFLTLATSQAGLAALVGALAFSVVYASTSFALRHARSGAAAPSRPGRPRQPELLDNPIAQLLARTSPGTLAAGAAGIAGMLLGSQAAGWWSDLLLLIHGGRFAYEDPVLGLDASFYVFVLPVLLIARSALMQTAAVAGIAALAIYLARGGIRVQLAEQEGQLVAQGIDMAMPVRRHLGTLAALLLLLMSIGAYLRRYTLSYEQLGLFPGPGYADIHGTLPLLTLQAAAIAGAAVLAYTGIERLRWSWLASAASLVVVFTSVTSMYPAFVQRFSVLPNELVREAPHIRNHVRATRAAFGLDKVEERYLSGDATLTWDDVIANAATVQNVRLWDHGPLLDTFSQVQEIRTYYSFEHVDNDRYVIDGQLRQIMMSARELDAGNLPARAQTWVNVMMTYTHGYGVALGPVNEVTPEGLPELFIKDLPPKIRYPDDLRIDRPEIYFGESMRTPVLVNTENPEFDYPAGDENRYTTYAGRGGVPLGTFGRLLFALRFGSTEMLLSSDVHPESRVLLHRNVMDRVRRIAPYLQYDSDPYLVIDEGRLVWIVDAYTTTDRFPYSKRVALPGSGRGGPHPNYLRNPIKVTVDAYDGTVELYLVDPAEPIAAVWARIFPSVFRPIEEMPASLRAHLRYPQDAFAVQSSLFAIYHMEDHHIFYNREDEWEIPTPFGRQMAPYYTIMKLPDEAREEFILMLPFTPSRKDNLAAWMVARSDGEAYGGLRVYKFPKEKMVYGPEMIVARINQDDAISEKVSLWNQQGSQVEMGTLLVIPIEESLIYVQPLYLKADNGSIPELKRVVVAYENRITMEPTLEGALHQLFRDRPGRSDAVASDRGPRPDAELADHGPLSPGTRALVQRAGEHWDAVNAAAAAGDWARYGVELQRLGEAMAALRSLEAEAPDAAWAGAGDDRPEAPAD